MTKLLYKSYVNIYFFLLLIFFSIIVFTSYYLSIKYYPNKVNSNYLYLLDASYITSPFNIYNINSPFNTNNPNSLLNPNNPNSIIDNVILNDKTNILNPNNPNSVFSPYNNDGIFNPKNPDSMFASPDFLKNFNITIDNLISLINKLLDIKNIDSPFYENNIYSPFNIRNFYSPQNSLISIKSFNLINVSNNTTQGSFTFNNIGSQIYNFNLYNSYIIGLYITYYRFFFFI